MAPLHRPRRRAFGVRLAAAQCARWITARAARHGIGQRNSQREAPVSSTDQQLLVSYHKLQQTVGWIALLMPIAVRVLALVFDHVFTTNSISAYYYTSLRDVFVGSLVVGGLLLAFFRTDDPKDRWLAIVAGLAAIGIALFPMDIAAGVLSSPDTANTDNEGKLVQALARTARSVTTSSSSACSSC